MKNEMHDCELTVVDNPNAGKKTIFQVVYPVLFKIIRFPSKCLMECRRYCGKKRTVYIQERLSYSVKVII